MNVVKMAAAAALLAFSVPQSASAACPPGKITCAQWCANHPNRQNCMTGHWNACDKKRNGSATCVNPN
jgi:hypothetical protein